MSTNAKGSNNCITQLLPRPCSFQVYKYCIIHLKQVIFFFYCGLILQRNLQRLWDYELWFQVKRTDQSKYYRAHSPVNFLILIQIWDIIYYKGLNKKKLKDLTWDLDTTLGIWNLVFMAFWYIWVFQPCDVILFFFMYRNIIMLSRVPYSNKDGSVVALMQSSNAHEKLLLIERGFWEWWYLCSYSWSQESQSIKPFGFPWQKRMEAIQ